jgi:hypothetical protein
MSSIATISFGVNGTLRPVLLIAPTVCDSGKLMTKADLMATARSIALPVFPAAGVPIIHRVGEAEKTLVILPVLSSECPAKNPAHLAHG